jgi:hypothetical protein
MARSRPQLRPLLAVLGLFVAFPVGATTLALRSETTVQPGVVLREYRASSPATDVWVLVVDLCADGVYLDSTRHSDGTQSTGSWGADVEATAAINGDFYKTSPLRVYGDAVGAGVRWPLDQTGLDPDYADEWYWEHAGWIAFGQDRLTFSHTGWVKERAAELGVAEGWENGDLQPDPPDGTIALVSGFPELVVEGTVMTCADPEDSSCFPDRSDMRDRNPRSAMGFTEDHSTLFFVVADGRTSDDAGLYGSELADIMGQLGAWEAFNLDGGGSSQLWVDGDYVNDIDGNNSGGGTRSVANHWGVFAGGRDWLPARPGHCETAPVCGTVGAGGGTIDDADTCFQTFGPREYWRQASDGNGGHLWWTNAWENTYPDNWAWWRTEMAEAGSYLVETYVEPDYSVFDDVEYIVVAAGTTTSVRIDPGGVEGWVPLGTFDFAAGSDQWIAVYDDQLTDPGSNQHIAADAVRLTRVGPWCGDGACDPDERCVCADCPPPTEELPDNGVDDDCDGAVDETGEDTGTSADSGTAGEQGDSDTPDSANGPGATRRAAAHPCGCGAGDGVNGWTVAMAGALWVGRRSRAPRGRPSA